ncbi:MAG TPA: nucleotidyltransferase family protein, partial [Thermoleophilaceae bacterium]|nr:nucleotidyltransferase family protein [Thermoleophilaceae bacterium]
RGGAERPRGRPALELRRAHPRGRRVIGGLVLAAGAGTRFGSAKQLAVLHGRPLLEYALRTMAAAPLDRVLVMLGSEAEEVMRGVDLHGAEPVVCDRWEEGQAASLACGLAELNDCEAVVVTLGDQPGLSPEAITRVLAARGDFDAVRATYAGEPGYPVLLERRLFGRLRDVSGDHGARHLLLSVPTAGVPCDDLGGPHDVDTQDQLAALRAGAVSPPPDSRS